MLRSLTARPQNVHGGGVPERRGIEGSCRRSRCSASPSLNCNNNGAPGRSKATSNASFFSCNKLGKRRRAQSHRLEKALGLARDSVAIGELRHTLVQIDRHGSPVIVIGVSESMSHCALGYTWASNLPTGSRYPGGASHSCRCSWVSLSFVISPSKQVANATMATSTKSFPNFSCLRSLAPPTAIQ